jgi:hypothetical protein
MLPTFAETADKPIIHKKWIVLACFIWKVRSQVVCVVESQTTAWKRAGQTGIVFETLEEWEEAGEEAVFRALREELDLLDRDRVDSIEPRPSFVLDIQWERERIIFDAKVFLVQLKEGTRISDIVSGHNELLGRWMRDVNSLNGDTRPGTLLALKLALWSYDRANPMPFVTARDGVETGEN